jgi:hypothetical protein
VSEPAKFVPSAAGESAHPLVSAARIVGRPVFDRRGERLGEIQDLMLHKASGRVAYAVMASDGAPDAERRLRSLPWSLLSYDVARGGYVLSIDRDRLERTPAVAQPGP